VAVLVLSFGPDAGFAVGGWDELDDRVGWLLPRVRAGFGVQEIWAHERFHLRVMITAMPEPEFRLTVFSKNGGDPLEDDLHPVWPIVARLAARNGWRVVRGWPHSGPVAIPAGAEQRSMPTDDSMRVREAVPVPGLDLSDMDTVDWSSLRHAFGPADDVPALIRAVGSGDRHARREAFRTLYGNVYHQGSTYTATVAAVPFLLRVVASAAADAQADVLEYLSAICARDESVIRAALPAEPLLDELATRADEVGRQAGRVVACLARLSPSAADRLEEFIRTAPDAVARADWLLWLRDLDDERRWADLLAESLGSAEPEVRLAAAMGLSRFGVATLPVLDVLFDAVEHPEPFTAWSRHESVWCAVGCYLSDLAFEHLVDLDPDAMARAVADAGGTAAARNRWPSLAEVDQRYRAGA
jgi:hypothetical protein